MIYIDDDLDIRWFKLVDLDPLSPNFDCERRIMGQEAEGFENSFGYRCFKKSLDCVGITDLQLSLINWW